MWLEGLMLINYRWTEDRVRAVDITSRYWFCSRCLEVGSGVLSLA